MKLNPRISPHQDGIVSREALARFLHQAWPEKSLETWLLRLKYWWDENPFCEAGSHHGYLATVGEEIVGFGGFIPARFAWQGQPVPALYATSFRVDECHSKAAATMFLNQREVMKQNIIIHSTPLPRIQTALLKLGGRGETVVTCHYIALGKLGCFNGLHSWPKLDSRIRVVTDFSEVRSLARPYQRIDRLEKWTTLESLQWFCNSPVGKHHFIGGINSEGVLTSFLLISLRRRKGINSWDVVEAFTTRENGTELLALIGTLVHEPDLLPGRIRLLTVEDFDHDPAFMRMPLLISRREKVCHYFLLPEELREVPKHTVLAEGDLGL